MARSSRRELVVRVPLADRDAWRRRFENWPAELGTTLPAIGNLVSLSTNTMR